MRKSYIFHYGRYQHAWEREELIQIGPNLNNSSRSIRSAGNDLKELIDILVGLSYKFEPLFFYTDNFFLRSCPLKNLKAWPAPLILVCGDLHHGKKPLETLKKYLSEENVDAVLLICNAGMVPAVRRFTTAPVRFLPPTFFKYPKAERWSVPNRQLIHVGSVGKYHKFRASIVRALIDQKDIPFQHFETKSPEEAAELYASNALVLNIPLNNDLNHRIYECMAAGAPQIIYGRPDLLGDQEVLGLREDLFWVESFEELVKEAGRLLFSPFSELGSIRVPPPPCWDINSLLKAALRPYRQYP
jgi:hypothetical protein